MTFYIEPEVQVPSCSDAENYMITKCYTSFKYEQLFIEIFNWFNMYIHVYFKD